MQELTRVPKYNQTLNIPNKKCWRNPLLVNCRIGFCQHLKPEFSLQLIDPMHTQDFTMFVWVNLIRLNLSASCGGKCLNWVYRHPSQLSFPEVPTIRYVLSCNIIGWKSINWGLSPKGEDRSGPKGLCYREKDSVIFVGLMQKLQSVKVLLPWAISLIWKIFTLPSLFSSLENRNFCRFSPNCVVKCFKFSETINFDEKNYLLVWKYYPNCLLIKSSRVDSQRLSQTCPSIVRTTYF